MRGELRGQRHIEDEGTNKDRRNFMLKDIGARFVCCPWVGTFQWSAIPAVTQIILFFRKALLGCVLFLSCSPAAENGGCEG